MATDDDDDPQYLVDVVSADFPQARVDQLEALCAHVRGALPSVGAPGGFAPTRRFVVGVAHIAATPRSVLPALLGGEVGGADGTPHEHAPSGAALAAELASLVLVDLFDALTRLPREQLARALRAYRLPVEPTDGADAAVREVVVDDGAPLSHGDAENERMADVLDSDDEDNALAEPFGAAAEGAHGTPMANGGAHDAELDDGEAPAWEQLCARLRDYGSHLSYPALAALPAHAWTVEPAGAARGAAVGAARPLVARVCALIARAAARASDAGRGARAGMDSSGAGAIRADRWAQLLTEHMLHTPTASAAVLEPCVHALSSLAASGAAARATIAGALAADVAWARGLGAQRPAVHAALAAETAVAAAAVRAIAARAAPPPPAVAAAVGEAQAWGWFPETSVGAEECEQVVCAAAAALTTFWAARAAPLTAAERERAACAAILLERTGLLAACAHLLSARPAAPCAAPCWAALLDACCRHAELAAFAVASPALRRAALGDGADAARAQTWGWLEAAARPTAPAAPAAGSAGARDAHAAAAAQLLSTAQGAAAELAHVDGGGGAGAGAAMAQCRALLRVLEALSTLCAAPHGRAIAASLAAPRTEAAGFPGPPQHLGDSLARALALISGSAARRPPAAEVAAAPAGDEPEWARKREAMRAQLLARAKEVQCAPAGKKD